MASLSRFGVVKSKPIVGGFNVFRDSFNSLCEGLGVSTSVDRLQHIGHGNAASDDAWDRYQGALQSELHMWYGVESDLTAWHALCRAIGVEPLPKTCEQCEQAVRKTHVNIVDLIEWGRGGSEEKVRTFRNVAELRAYTKDTGKIFRITFDQESGNVILRHLLRNIFRASL